MKTTLLLLLMTSLVLLAQAPPDGYPAAPAANAATITNRDELLRRAMRDRLAGKTNVTIVPTINPTATNVPAKPTAAPALPTLPAATAPQPAATTPVPTAPGAPKPDETLVAIPPPGGTNAPVNPEDEKGFEAGVINFPAVDIEDVLKIYAMYVGRTVLRPSVLPAPKITLVNQTPLTRKEAIQALDSVLALNGITMIPSGEKFVKAVPSTQAMQEAAAFSKLDGSQLPEAAQYITHIVQLKYARPSEVVPVLQPFAKIPNSILPVESSQILVIRDYAENVKRMLELIKQIDIIIPSEIISEVIPIKYALAGDIASVLSSLTTGGGGVSGGTTTGRTARGPSAMGRTGAGGVGSRGGIGGYGTGTLAPGVPGQPGTPIGGLGVNPTQPGTSFQQRLQNIVNRAQQAGEFQIIGEAKIIADERTNSLLIFASKQDLAAIKDIVAKLDVVLAQVLIEAIIMEVSLDDTRNLGVSYLGNPKGNGYFSGVGAIKNHSDFLNLGNFASGGTNAAGGLPGGFSYFGKFGNDLEATVTAIATDARINVLSRPRIQTSHAVEARLKIGDTVPYVSGTYFNGIGGGASSQYQQTFVGIELDVLPLINPEGLVVMDITQDIQQLGTPTIIDGNPVPTTTQRSASAKVSVRDRETIILGGFISSTKSNSKSGVPLLKDIPLLGYLFRSTSDSTKRVELVVLMRPTVLPTPEAAALQATVEQEKLPGVRKAEAEFKADETRRLKQAEKDTFKE
ncbi:MAG: hypothetical protein HY298_14705 [Verrucomicrobia bacterium]|nr:hypothetical protein [Verrucomicrobiota bacterium]